MHVSGPGQQIINRGLRIQGKAIRQNGQNVVEPSLRIQASRFGGFQSGENDHAGIGSGLGITEEPVLPANHNWADCVLYLVVTDFNFTMMSVTTEAEA